MTQPQTEQKQPTTAAGGFSAEQTTEDALKTAVAAAVAAWLAGSATAILSGTVPDLSMMLDSSRYISDAVARMGRTLRETWASVYARTGTDMRSYIDTYLQELPFRLDGLSKLAWRRAATALADAQAGFDDLDAMRARVRASLDPALYGGYIDRVAASEASISVNGARHQVAMNAYERGATVSKTWKTRDDARVRHTHQEAEDQTVPFTTPFVVGGWPMQHPGDPTAPASETANCRCIAKYHVSGGRR